MRQTSAPVREMSIRPAYKVVYWCAALVAGLSGARHLANGDSLGFLLIGAASIGFIAAMFYSAFPLVEIYEDRVVWKTALLSPRRIVPFRNLISVVQHSSKSASVTLRLGDGARTWSLPARLLGERDLSDLVRWLQGQTPKSSPPPSHLGAIHR